jgi:hypothetical protein
MQSITQKRASAAPELLKLIGEIVAKSPDLSCFASLSFLSASLGRRKADVSAAKWELVNSGQVVLDFRSNGNRRNLRHRLSLPDLQSAPVLSPKRKGSQKRITLSRTFDPTLTTSPDSAHTAPPKNAMSRVPDHAHYHGNVTGSNLQGLEVWGELSRTDQIAAYLASGWNICPLVPYGKKPVYTKTQWSGFNRDEKLHIFKLEDDYNVGMWINRLTIFDYDSDRQPENTLVAVRGDHSHNYFQPHPAITSTVKQVADDIDTRCKGSLIVLPPSVHETGMPYEWAVLLNPQPVPDKLMVMWHSRLQRVVYSLKDLPAIIRQGERDNTIWCFGRRLKAAGATFTEIDRQLRTLNRERCSPRLSDRDITSKIAHVWTHGNRRGWTPA